MHTFFYIIHWWWWWSSSHKYTRNVPIKHTHRETFIQPATEFCLLMCYEYSHLSLFLSLNWIKTMLLLLLLLIIKNNNKALDKNFIQFFLLSFTFASVFFPNLNFFCFVFDEWNKMTCHHNDDHDVVRRW